MRSRRPLAALAAALLAAGCAQRALDNLGVGKARDDLLLRRGTCARSACRDSVDLLYLGVGGFVIRHGDDALMTAPSVSHRRLLAVLFRRPIASDSTLVDTLMTQVGRRLLPPEKVSGILVGHGHYDHLLDVPRTMKWTPNARVYGSATVKNLLAPFPTVPESMVVAVDQSAGDAHAPAYWVYTADSAFRFKPLRSKHAPNFLRYTIAPGREDTALKVPPRRPQDWTMGPVYAYHIEVLDASRKPIFRVLYQDAAAARAWESIPPDLRGDTVDVAIITVGNFKGWLGLRDYPHALLDSLNVRRVVLGHWEDFFRSPLDSLRVLPLTNTGELVRRVERSVGQGNWATFRPLAGERYVF